MNYTVLLHWIINFSHLILNVQTFVTEPLASYHKRLQTWKKGQILQVNVEGFHIEKVTFNSDETIDLYTPYGVHKIYDETKLKFCSILSCTALCTRSHDCDSLKVHVT